MPRPIRLEVRTRGAGGRLGTMRRKGGPGEGGGEFDVEAVLDELYTTPPPGFVARREELAVAARTAGRTADSRRIRAARRPTLAAWAANLLLRREPDESRRLLDLGAALREAYRTLDPAALKDLTAQRRHIVSALSREAARLADTAGHRLSAAAQQEVAATLHAVLADPDAAEQWASGRLTGALSPPSAFLSPDPDAARSARKTTPAPEARAEPATKPTRTSAKKSVEEPAERPAERPTEKTAEKSADKAPKKAARQSSKTAQPPPPPRDELAERRRIREEQLAEARRATEEAERRLGERRDRAAEAEESLTRARERREAARAELDAAEQRLRTAREALRDADRARREAEERHRSAADALTTAAREARAAAAALRRLESRTGRREQPPR
jgi:chromosome segregation ATPase